MPELLVATGWRFTQCCSVQRGPWPAKTRVQPFLVGEMFNFITNPGTAFTRQAFEAAEGFEPNLTLAEDYDLYLRMAGPGCVAPSTKNT